MVTMILILKDLNGEPFPSLKGDGPIEARRMRAWPSRSGSFPSLKGDVAMAGEADAHFAFPSLKGDGPIEARRMRAWPSRSGSFPSLKGDGPIEALAVLVRWV